MAQFIELLILTKKTPETYRKVNSFIAITSLWRYSICAPSQLYNKTEKFTYCIIMEKNNYEKLLPGAYKI
jgi:hypothetical protein